MMVDRFVRDLYDAWRWPYFKDSFLACPTTADAALHK
jgi:hypothetical protein